jgi:signal transduction histidine kinase
MRHPRPTARLRLTAWYALIFFALGLVLLGSSYAVVRHEFSGERTRLQVSIDSGPAVRVRIAPGLPPLDGPLAGRLSRQEREVYARARSAYREAAQAADERALRRVVTAFALVLVLLTLASIGAGWIIAGRVLRPIARITSAARGISEGTLHERIALDGPRDELRELADTFDTMLARLERAFESRNRFVSSASHELLTPLAIVRMELDVTLADPAADTTELRRMAAVIAATNERMEQLVKSLLTLASADGGIARSQPTDLADLAGGVLDARARRRGPAGGPDVRVDLDAAPVAGDPVLLERLAENLIANAERYNEPGGFVAVSTRAAGGRCVLRVENPGRRLGADEVAGLTEPFHRLEGSRSRDGGGYGLGLAVASAVAQANGGRLELAPREGGGLVATVTLPARAAASQPVLR